MSYNQYRPVDPPAFLNQDDMPSCRSCPDLFEVAADMGNRSQETKRVKLICQACPYIEPCRAYGLITNQRWGVWGGLTVEERRKLRQEGNRRALVDAV